MYGISQKYFPYFVNTRFKLSFFQVSYFSTYVKISVKSFIHDFFTCQTHARLIPTYLPMSKCFKFMPSKGTFQITQ